MKHSCFFKVILSLLLASLIHGRSYMSLPQPGQNLWHVIAQTGTEVETLLACCQMTFTAIGNQTAPSISALDACCQTIQSSIDIINQEVISDFAGTFTALSLEQAILKSEIDACCLQTLSELQGTTTLLKQDFNGTFTVLASISQLIAQNFNHTMTAIAPIGCQPGCDLSGTITAIQALGDCNYISLSQANVSNGGIVLSSQGVNYCLSQSITGSVIINASNITLDLNSYNIFGTIDISGSVTNVIVQNGKIKPNIPLGSTDASHAAIVIGGFVTYASISNCTVLCSDSTGTAFAGRSGINNSSSTGTTIENCFIQAGSGGAGQNGGDGIDIIDGFTTVKNSMVMGGNGIVGGNGISIQNSGNNVLDNVIIKGGVGNSSGGSGIILTVNGNDTANLISNSIAVYSGGNGFSVVGISTNINLVKCVASFNTGSGFDFSAVTGTSSGLIQGCIASHNTTFGFNTTSGYQFVSCVAEGNGISASNVLHDSNYCLNGVTTAVGATPFYQILANTTGITSSEWSNVTAL